MVSTFEEAQSDRRSSLEIELPPGDYQMTVEALGLGHGWP